MKTLFSLLVLSLALTALADDSHFSIETKVLTIPALVVDGSTYYENVLLELDTDTGQFILLSSTKAEFPSGSQLLQLDFDETKLLRDASLLSFVAVQSDSRCPLAVQCITAGFVEVTLQLQDATIDQNFEIKLRLDENGTELSVPGTEANGLYFRLREVNPYPADEQGIENAKYSAVVEYSSESF